MPKLDKLDSIIRVVTPENIGFEYRLAGPFRRLPAFIIDFSIVCAINVAIFVIFSLTVTWISLGLAAFSMFVTWFAVFWFFGGLCETFLNGQTPGKWLLGLRTLTYDGQPISALQAIFRNLMRAADLLMPLLGLVVMMFNRRFQRLGDLVAGTIVVVEERHWLTGVAKLDDPRAIQLAAYLPPNYVVSRSQARALATYVERRKFFSLPRRREVAKHLAEPLLAKFGLPPDTSYDLLLCSLFYRTFIADRGDDEKQLEAARKQNPFAGMQAPGAYPQPYGAPQNYPYGYGQPVYMQAGYGQPYQPGFGQYPPSPPPAPLPLPQETMAGITFDAPPANSS
ncbi:MAG: RDD family protein [Pirellulaceae bacterium]|nr:RDD family protein [Pirellulaceae bacterium]